MEVIGCQDWEEFEEGFDSGYNALSVKKKNQDHEMKANFKIFQDMNLT